ncbi:hypothetical protein, partial [Nocardia flavorosea]|uniref:hypothetical protein n=1 Tax=Nocardia flavorosea TaxID=53429 RepID=UPI002455633F
ARARPHAAPGHTLGSFNQLTDASAIADTARTSSSGKCHRGKNRPRVLTIALDEVLPPAHWSTT